nr:K(+)-transporting ATPase subunit F [Streptomyces sp. SID8377]
MGAHDDRPRLRRHHDRGLRTGRPDRQGGGQAVSAENIAGLVVAAALLVYLIAALVRPERF